MGQGMIIGDFACMREHMAKSDSFFIRATVTAVGTAFNQAEIDLGSFVNLGVKSSTLLRIHNIQADYKDASDPGAYIYYDGGIPGAQVLWQLTTQSQSDMIYADDKSYVSGGSMKQASTTGNLVQNSDETVNQNPQEWTQGYLVGVDSMFLGAQSSGTWDTGDIRVDVVLECTLETATQASATALALSQQ